MKKKEETNGFLYIYKYTVYIQTVVDVENFATKNNSIYPSC